MVACENPRKNIAHFMSICNFDRSCICVFVFVYLYVRHSVTWILTSSYHYLLNKLQKLEDALIKHMLTAADMGDRGDKGDIFDRG